MLFSFDSRRRRAVLEVTGTERRVVCPDPNMFEGGVSLCSVGAEQWETIGWRPPQQSSRGIGVLDMARGIRTGAAASGDWVVWPITYST